jgi:hypothetical protein
VGAAETTSPYAFSWDTTKTSNGSHILNALATDTNGLSTTSAGVTVTVSNTTAQPPSVPTGLIATAASSSQINLSWNASNDTAGTLAGYKVYRGGSQIGTSTTTSYQDTGLAASTSYTYNVAAYDTSGNTSAQSAGASATTQSSSGGGGIPSALGWYQIPNTTLAPVCSTDQNIQGSTGCSAVISAWSGGIADTKRNRLVIWGGGHSDYYGNELYALDLNTLSMLRLNNPSDPAGSCTAAAPDGKPTSRHTYNGLAYISDLDSMYVLGGALACSTGEDSNDTWILNLGTLQWTRKDPTNSGAGNGITSTYDGKYAAYDPVGKLVYANDAFNFWSYDPNANKYTNLNTGSLGIAGGATGEIDPVRRLFIVFGRGVAVGLNLTTGTVNDWSSTASGCSALINNDYPGIAYDSSRGLMVGWVGGNTVYEFNPDTKACNAVTWPNGPGAAQANGTYGRFRYFPALNVFAVINDWQENAYTLRLTSGSGSGTPGPVISAVGATSLTSNSFTVNWTTDVAATSQVDYGTTTAYGTTTTLNSTLATSHSVTLTGLQAGTLYHYRVRSKNSGGTESVSGDFAVTTSAAGDTTPPTVSITAPAGGSTASGTVTISANAADNVAVASVQFLVDGTAVGSPVTASPYSVSWDSTTVSNGTHALSATATDTSSNSATSTAVSVTVSNQSVTALQDFQQRCAAPGVLVCQGFDSPSDFVVQTTGASGLYAGSNGVKGTMDTSITASGAGALRFEIDGLTSAGGAGFWRQAFGQNFTPNTTFYLQYRYRVDTTFTTVDWTSFSGGVKQSIFHMDGSTCASIELTTQRIESPNLPIMYTDCGARGLYVSPPSPGGAPNPGNPPYYKQQGDTTTTGYNCAYGTNYGTDPNCFNYPANTWMTFYYIVHVGDWGQPNSTVQSWVGVPGQPMKQWINTTGLVLNCNDSPCGTDSYNSVDLLNYMTGKDPTVNHPTAYTWYDELIVSSQPIAAPKVNQ